MVWAASPAVPSPSMLTGFITFFFCSPLRRWMLQIQMVQWWKLLPPCHMVSALRWTQRHRWGTVSYSLMYSSVRTWKMVRLFDCCRVSQSARRVTTLSASSCRVWTIKISTWEIKPTPLCLSRSLSIKSALYLWWIQLPVIPPGVLPFLFAQQSF